MSWEHAKHKLDELEATYEEIGRKLADPQITADLQQYRQLSKSYSDLTEIVSTYRELKQVVQSLEEAESLLHDEELGQLAQADVDELRPRLEEISERLKVLLLPKDPNDEKNVLVEIRAGTGGEEAALFAGDLFRMYCRYAERRGWKYDILSEQETGIGGYKEVVLSIEGSGAYSQLKYESGVHRVQRVPVTEASGRIHTSAATVAVLPEAEDVEVEISPNDIEMDIYHSSSAGGQNVQKVATAIRVLHKPSGIVVTCQDERSQLQNKEKAMRMLRARLYDIQQQQQQAEITAARRSQIGTGDRSEKIRTYNFPDGRVTDHRVGLTIYNIPVVLDGGLQSFIDALATADQAEKLRIASAA
ncbi:MAG: peptide chain release factor 1 [Armatimonadetes bacterium]|nr:peptide chain release factor 1 [Armatimonadota bacterium]